MSLFLLYSIFQRKSDKTKMFVIPSLLSHESSIYHWKILKKEWIINISPVIPFCTTMRLRRCFMLKREKGEVRWEKFQVKLSWHSIWQRLKNHQHCQKNFQWWKWREQNEVFRQATAPSNLRGKNLHCRRYPFHPQPPHAQVVSNSDVSSMAQTNFPPRWKSFNFFYYHSFPRHQHFSGPSLWGKQRPDPTLLGQGWRGPALGSGASLSGPHRAEELGKEKE